MSAHWAQVCDLGPVRGMVVTSIPLSLRNIQVVARALVYSKHERELCLGGCKEESGEEPVRSLLQVAMLTNRRRTRHSGHYLPELPTSQRLVLACNHDAFQVLMIKNFVT